MFKINNFFAKVYFPAFICKCDDGKRGGENSARRLTVCDQSSFFGEFIFSRI